MEKEIKAAFERLESSVWDVYYDGWFKYYEGADILESDIIKEKEALLKLVREAKRAASKTASKTGGKASKS